MREADVELGGDAAASSDPARFMPDVRGMDTGRDTSCPSWFHGSPHEIEPGTILKPGARAANFAESPDDSVSLTSEARTAVMWARQAAGADRPTYLYEVELVAPAEVHRVGPKDYGQRTAYHEVRTARARVVRRVET